MDSLQRILTEDGSHTLLNTKLQEQYHSKHGAIQESLHVFIRMGLDIIIQQKNVISILEIGFGTGLNAYLTLLEGAHNNVAITYTTIETFPIDTKVALELNYPQQVLNKTHDKLFEQLHEEKWNELIAITDQFKLLKLNTTLEKFESNQLYDLIYFDAFSPKTQPEMWTVEQFSKLFHYMNNGALLVTYCAKGEVKRALKSAGFKVIGMPGPPGKREMTVAIKD